MFNLLLRCMDFQHRKMKTPRTRFGVALIIRRAEYLRNRELLHHIGACPCHECGRWGGESDYAWRYEPGCYCQPCFALDLHLEGGDS
jgi:hypothetical protein